jgi:hypothetical protein
MLAEKESRRFLHLFHEELLKARHGVQGVDGGREALQLDYNCQDDAYIHIKYMRKRITICQGEQYPI